MRVEDSLSLVIVMMIIVITYSIVGIILINKTIFSKLFATDLMVIIIISLFTIMIVNNTRTKYVEVHSKVARYDTLDSLYVRQTKAIRKHIANCAFIGKDQIKSWKGNVIILKSNIR